MALGQYGNSQESISRRLEQPVPPFDTKLEWPGEGAIILVGLE